MKVYVGKPGPNLGLLQRTFTTRVERGDWKVRDFSGERVKDRPNMKSGKANERLDPVGRRDGPDRRPLTPGIVTDPGTRRPRMRTLLLQRSEPSLARPRLRPVQR